MATSWYPRGCIPCRPLVVLAAIPASVLLVSWPHGECPPQSSECLRRSSECLHHHVEHPRQLGECWHHLDECPWPLSECSHRLGECPQRLGECITLSANGGEPFLRVLVAGSSCPQEVPIYLSRQLGQHLSHSFLCTMGSLVHLHQDQTLI